MAEFNLDAAHLEEIEPDSPICQICLERCRDAKKLKCRHTLCQGCLDQLCSDTPKPKCPTCRTPFTTTDLAVPDLPSNLATETLQAVLVESCTPATRPSICDGCESTSPVAWCIDCAIKLCEVCRKAHHRMRLTKGHAVIPLSECEDDSIDLCQQNISFCDKHEANQHKIYCLTCKVCLCYECTLFDHKSHEYIPIADATEGLKLELENYSRDLRSKFTQITEVKVEVNRELSAAKRFYECEKSKAENYYQNMLQTATEKFEDIKREILSLKAKVVEPLESEYESKRQHLTSHLEEIESLIDRVAVARSAIDKAACQPPATVISMQEQIVCQARYALETQVEMHVSPGKLRASRDYDDGDISPTIINFTFEHIFPNADDKFTSTKPSLLVQHDEGAVTHQGESEQDQDQRGEVPIGPTMAVAEERPFADTDSTSCLSTTGASERYLIANNGGKPNLDDSDAGERDGTRSDDAREDGSHFDDRSQEAIVGNGKVEESAVAREVDRENSDVDDDDVHEEKELQGRKDCFAGDQKEDREDGDDFVGKRLPIVLSVDARDVGL